MFYWLGGVGLVLSVSLIYSRYSPYLKLGYALAKLATSNLISKDTSQEIVHVAGNVYTLTYLHKGREHKIFIPIKESSKSRRYDTYIQVGDISVDITQQQGVPYSITASDFGSPEATIVMVDEMNDEVRSYQGEEEVAYF